MPFKPAVDHTVVCCIFLSVYFCLGLVYPMVKLEQNQQSNQNP